MIGIRFHGRGGHGVKTASRIAGTSAFLAGYQVQDCPLYGAERRGAAVVASTRIAEAPILQRGMVTEPDLIILADESLLNDPGAGVLSGQESSAALFINTGDVDGLHQPERITVPIVHFDVTGCTLDMLGRASALSAGLGAAAARLCGLVSLEALCRGLAEEFEELELSEELLEKNQRIAERVFAALEPIDFQARRMVPESHVVRVTADDPVRGSPSILAAGNAAQRRTGAWRVERPVVDRDICTRCGLCLVRCPDGAIALDEEGYPVIDYDHCKGCMICRHECPVAAMAVERETKAW